MRARSSSAARPAICSWSRAALDLAARSPRSCSASFSATKIGWSRIVSLLHLYVLRCSFLGDHASGILLHQFELFCSAIRITLSLLPPGYAPDGTDPSDGVPVLLPTDDTGVELPLHAGRSADVSESVLAPELFLQERGWSARSRTRPSRP